MKLLDALRSIPDKLAVMSPRRLVLLAFALSVIVAGIIYVILTGFLTPAKQAAAQPQYENVVVAAVDISERSRITKDMLKTINVPKGVVPQDAIRSVDEAVGKIAAKKIMAGDAVTQQKLMGGKGFTGTIPDNMRAITIPVNDVTGVAGLVKPGDYVDIFLVSSKAYKNAVYGKLILQNVLLLAVNSSFDNAAQPTDTDGANAAKQPQTAAKAGMVTIAVQPSDILRVQGATQEGTLYLALRPDVLSESYTVIPDYFQYMAGGPEESKAQPAQQPVQQQPAALPASYYPASQPAASSGGSSGYSSGGRNIEVIRGNSVSQVNIR